MCALKTGLLIDPNPLTVQVAFCAFPPRLPTPRRPLGIVLTLPAGVVWKGLICPSAPSAGAGERGGPGHRHRGRAGARPVSGCVTGGTSQPDAVVIQTDLIAGRHDTHFLDCTRRSVRGAGQPAAHPGACVQTRPPALRGPRGRKRVLPVIRSSFSVVKKMPPDVNN